MLEKGPSCGLKFNLDKCEIFWSTGDQMFSEFPTAIRRICLIESGAKLLGSPIIGSDHYFDEFISKRVNSVLQMQSRLPDCSNSQIEFHLLRSCLGLCKINHILRTVYHNHTMSRFTAFDASLRHSLKY